MSATKPLASLSLDLDDKWTYLKTRGDRAWETLPSYLGVLIPRVLDFLSSRDLTITVFVVGQDAALRRNRDVLRSLAEAGHEVGNHSFRHEPWMHTYAPAEVEREIVIAEENIERATGRRPVGFRGPGFSLPPVALPILARRGYRYDASTFPTYLIPLARACYFMTANLTPDERRQRQSLGGTFTSGLRPITPYRWQTAAGPLLEIPVTTLPCLKVPIHASYLMCLATISPRLARWYFDLALWACRSAGTAPSLLLHPTDFLGCDDTHDLAFFPGMALPSEIKLELMSELIRRLSSVYTVVPLEEHARSLGRDASLPIARMEKEEAVPPPRPAYRKSA
jgi:hypothetical protein